MPIILLLSTRLKATNILNVRLLILYRVLSFLEGKHLEAIEEYLAAIELDPTVPAYFSNASSAFANIDEHERAVEMAHKAIELDPTFSKAYYRRAVSLMALGEYKRAMKDLQLLLQAAPADINVRTKICECEKLNIQKNFALALRVNQFDLDESAISKLEIPEGYSGPRLSSFDRIPEAFIPEIIEWFKLENKLSIKVAYMVLNAARKIFVSNPNCLHITVPVGVRISVCGDVHGQFYDLIKIFEMNGYPSSTHYYLFNGDFVDRGAHSIEVILTMFALKAAYPNYFFMARGNHESEHINRMHGFMEETKRKYDERMFAMMNKVFNALPLAHVIQDKIFVVHGGLPKKEDFVLADINAIDRFRDPPNGTLFSQLLWSDPKQTCGISPSHRGEGILFGPDVTESFLARNDLQMIIRSHVWEPTGYKIEHDGKCVTIFSAPNYT